MASSSPPVLGVLQVLVLPAEPLQMHRHRSLGPRGVAGADGREQPLVLAQGTT